MWKMVQTCACGCANNACVGSSCKPGETRCNVQGNGTDVCDNSGCKWNPGAACPACCSNNACSACPDGHTCSTHANCQSACCSRFDGSLPPFNGVPYQCRPRTTRTHYGCSQGYVVGCASNCFACTSENGFFAYNDAGCGGITCFNRFVNNGTYGPLVVMFTRSAGYTAHARYFFPGNEFLCGNYTIYANVPSLPGANPTNADPNCKWSLDTQTTYILYDYNNAEMRRVTIDQSAMVGRGKFQLFQADLTGAMYINILNHWPNHASCGQILLDYIQAVPY